MPPSAGLNVAWSGLSRGIDCIEPKVPLVPGRLGWPLNKQAYLAEQLPFINSRARVTVISRYSRKSVAHSDHVVPLQANCTTDCCFLFQEANFNLATGQRSVSVTGHRSTDDLLPGSNERLVRLPLGVGLRFAAGRLLRVVNGAAVAPGLSGLLRGGGQFLAARSAASGRPGAPAAAAPAAHLVAELLALRLLSLPLLGRRRRRRCHGRAGRARSETRVRKPIRAGRGDSFCGE